MRELLLSLHVLAAVVWLGAGLYDLFIIREISRSRGTDVEVVLIRIHLRYGPVIAVATMVVFVTGILMSSFLGWGYFTRLWLGLKQGLMLVVVALMILFVPSVMRLQRAVNALPSNATVGEEIRSLVATGVRYEVAMRAAALVAFFLAIYRPG